MAAGVSSPERSEPGGIRQLVELIDEHRAAFEYDWRARFHLPLSVVGRAMSWGEAVRLTTVLASEPGSFVGAALAGWDYPMSRLGLAVLDLFDLTHAVGAAGGKTKPKPYPRPWPTDNGKRTTKPDASLTQADIIAALRFAGHTAALPT